MVQKDFLENRFQPNFFIITFLVEFFWVQNNYLKNRFKAKTFIKTFFVEIYFGCKMISSKTGLIQKISSRISL